VSLPRFVEVAEAVVIQESHIGQTGGAGTTYDAGALDGALYAACNRYFYAAPCDLFELAAYYVFHIAKGHAFIDGNKRTAVSVALYFLEKNGIDRVYWPRALILMTRGISEGVVSPGLLAIYLRQRSYCLSAMIVGRTAILLAFRRSLAL
jgi:death-on-curing protein